MSEAIDPIHSKLLKKWMYKAISNATLDELYQKHFAVQICLHGFAGENCDQHCDPIHGSSDRYGVCVCESTKWTGVDCSEEVPEDLNLLPDALKRLGYAMFGINVACVITSGVWLWYNRRSAKVEKDDGDGPVYACVAIPWLYSVGFSVTFGTLYAKIRRVHILFKSAANMARITVTARETLFVIGLILFVDVTILTVWTVFDPLVWTRTVESVDKFGEPLSSEGYDCASDHWMAFSGTIAGLHLALLGYDCSIFLIGLPVLFIVGSDPDTAFFVRSIIVWMNDFAVIALLFGDLAHSVHVDKTNISIRSAISDYSRSLARDDPSEEPVD